MKGGHQAIPARAGVHSGRIVFHAGVAIANPTRPTVVNGKASIRQQGNLLQITNSPNSIINGGASRSERARLRAFSSCRLRVQF